MSGASLYHQAKASILVVCAIFALALAVAHPSDLASESDAGERKELVLSCILTLMQD